MISRSTARPQLAALRRNPAWPWIPLSLAACLLLACPSADEPRQDTMSTVGKRSPKTVEVRSTEPPERDLDAVSLRNMSELLAGLPPRGEKDADAGDDAADDAEEDLTTAEIPPVWRRHVEESEAIWSRLAPRFDAMRAWSASTMAELPAPRAPVLAPFGDPDLIAALSLFPDARSFLLVGHEAPGRVPLPEDFSGEEMEDDLRRLRSAFLSLADSGYFVRSRIQDGVRGGAFDGVLPVLLVSLVRGGQVPVKLDYVGFDPETREIQPLPPDAAAARALRIFFRPQGAEGPLRTVYYFARDLSNEGLLTDESLAYLLRRQEALNVFLKAAEYRLHSSEYSLFRKLLLEEASSLLQDDSGVPIRFLTSDRWKLHLYGRYQDVLAAYRAYRQDDLAAAFHKARPPALGFPIGFNSGDEGGGLVLALRKTAGQGTERAVAPPPDAAERTAESGP